MAPLSPKVLFGHHAISERDHQNNTTLLISGKRKKNRDYHAHQSK